MIRDGIDRPPVSRALAKEGWAHISTAPIATPDIVNLSAGIDVVVDPMSVEGLTADGIEVIAYYDARGDYEDRWTNRYGSKVYQLTHWRHLS